MTVTESLRDPSRAERMDQAAQSAQVALADLYIAIYEATTNAEALNVHRLLSQLVSVLGTAQNAALLRADELCGGK